MKMHKNLYAKTNNQDIKTDMSDCYENVSQPQIWYIFKKHTKDIRIINIEDRNIIFDIQLKRW